MLVIWLPIAEFIDVRWLMISCCPKWWWLKTQARYNRSTEGPLALSFRWPLVSPWSNQCESRAPGNRWPWQLPSLEAARTSSTSACHWAAYRHHMPVSEFNVRNKTALLCPFPDFITFNRRGWRQGTEWFGIAYYHTMLHVYCTQHAPCCKEYPNCQNVPNGTVSNRYCFQQ